MKSTYTFELPFNLEDVTIFSELYKTVRHTLKTSTSAGIKNLCVRHKADQLLCVAALREEDDQVFLPHNAKVSMECICWIEVHRLCSRGDEGL